MFPLKDNNPTQTRAYVTMLFIAINVVVFLYELTLGDHVEGFVAAWGAIPYEIVHFEDLVGPAGGGFNHTAGPPFLPLTLLSSMFMHGSIMHIFGNMLFLWIFGDNLENAMGRIRYLIFYLVTGIIASLAHVISTFVFGDNPFIPSLGASGAISGVLGGYLVLYPKKSVRVIMLRMLTTVPAIVAIGLWFVFQLISAFGVIGAGPQSGGGVAFMAHIGGFVAGLVLVKFFTLGRTPTAVQP